VVAAAGGPGGLRAPDLEPLATVLGIGMGRLAETVDDLTAEGVLELADGCWRCAVPALATTLAGSALPPAVAVALAVRSLASPPEAHQHETARRIAGLTGAAAAALPAMLALLVDTALTGPPGGGAGPAEPLEPASRTRLLGAVAEALERADPGSHLAGQVPRLAEAALLAFISGEERLGRRIAAAGVRWLRGVARAPATAGAAYRELARLRAVARRSGPALGRFGTGSRVPADEPGSAWPALLLTRATLVAAADGAPATWSAAWRRWRDAGGAPARDGGDAVRALAAWGSRREALAALEGRTAAGPVGAYLAGDWDRVAAVGRRFLAAGAHPVAAPEPDELASAAVALLVAVHRREVRTARALVRRLASSGAGGRPPVVGYALGVAALREHADASAVLDMVRAELRRVRRDGPRLGVDLLLFAAARLGDVVTGGAPAGGVAPELAELAELADELGNPRAHLLAARALPPAPDRLRAALAGPAPERFLGTLGRAQAMVLLAAQLPPGDPEAADLAAVAGDLLAPLRATDWLQQARGLLPVPTSPGSGARSRAMADQVRQLVGEGLTNRQISARLNLSEKSVEGYVTRLLRTYGCANRAELAARSATPTRTPPVATLA
jgi:hypothetical protein